MKIQESLNSAARFAATRWQAARSEGREAETSLWIQMNGYREFIMETGQLYLFEKYLGERIATSAPRANSVLDAREETVSYRIMLLLLRVLDEALALEQRRAVALLMGQLEFLSDSGQLELVEDYVIHRLEYAPIAIARFTTQNEARAWLNGLS